MVERAIVLLTFFVLCVLDANAQKHYRMRTHVETKTVEEPEAAEEDKTVEETKTVIPKRPKFRHRKHKRFKSDF